MKSALELEKENKRFLSEMIGQQVSPGVRVERDGDGEIVFMATASIPKTSDFDYSYGFEKKIHDNAPLRGFGRDMFLELVELEAVTIPAIDEIEKACDELREEAWEAFSAGHYKIHTDVLDVISMIKALHSSASDLCALTTQVPGVGADWLVPVMAEMKYPLDPYLCERISKGADEYLAACRASVVDRYEEIIKLGRMQDKEKAIIDGAIFALQTCQIDACRGFIDMIGDDETTDTMIGLIELIRIDLASLRRTRPHAETLESMLKTMVRSMPYPGGIPAASDPDHAA